MSAHCFARQQEQSADVTSWIAQEKFVNTLVHIDGMDAMILRQIMSMKRMFDYVYDTDKWFRPILRNRHLLGDEDTDLKFKPTPVTPPNTTEHTEPSNGTAPEKHPILDLPSTAFHNPRIHNVPAIHDPVDLSTKIEQAYQDLGLSDIDFFYGRPGGSQLKRENHTQEGILNKTIGQDEVSFSYCEVNCDKLIEPFQTECKRMRVGRYNYIKNLHNGVVPETLIDCHEMAADEREKKRIVFIDKSVIDKPGDPLKLSYASEWVDDRTLNQTPY
jgi:hypothetical protein